MQNSSNSNSISTELGSLHYVQYGSGPKKLLVFHGFGQDHTIAVQLLKVLQDDYTIFSFDLPYHGKSDWSETECLITKENIRELFSGWLKENSILEFSVLGYSMGGKFALSISEQFVKQIEHCILIAPDGLYKSPWYRMAISFPIKTLFRHIIHHPGLFLGITWFVSKTRLVSLKLMQFATSQMTTDKQRKQVYYTWVNFQKLYTSKQQLQKLVDENELQLNVILGDKDSVISPKTIVPIVDGIKDINVTILPIGHGRLFSESIPLLSDLMKEE